MYLSLPSYLDIFCLVYRVLFYRVILAATLFTYPGKVLQEALLAAGVPTGEGDGLHQHGGAVDAGPGVRVEGLEPRLPRVGVYEAVHQLLDGFHGHVC